MLVAVAAQLDDSVDDLATSQSVGSAVAVVVVGGVTVVVVVVAVAEVGWIGSCWIDRTAVSARRRTRMSSMSVPYLDDFQTVALCSSLFGSYWMLMVVAGLAVRWMDGEMGKELSEMHWGSADSYQTIAPAAGAGAGADAVVDYIGWM